VDQYSGDVLADFKAQLVAQLPEALAAEIPELPPMGNLDLNLVLQSEYFFA
jgi:DNA-directed RNA polymerase